jgi:hypothetical protein
MPLGSSSAAPVISPGPSTRHKRGLLGPTTALGAAEGFLLSKQMLPTQSKLRSSDDISLKSTWHSATQTYFDQMIPQVKRMPLSGIGVLSFPKVLLSLPPLRILTSSRKGWLGLRHLNSMYEIDDQSKSLVKIGSSHRLCTAAYPNVQTPQGRAVYPGECSTTLSRRTARS